MINGIVYDFEDIVLATPAGWSATLSSISYPVSRDIDVVTGVNGMPIGWVRKKFEGTVECEIGLAEYEILSTLFPVGGILGADPMPITITYGAVGKVPVIDVLPGVKITEVSRKADKESEVRMQLKGKMTAIPVLGGKPVIIPGLAK